MKPDQERVHALLVDTVTLLCKNGLNFTKGLKVEGVLGITVDDQDVFIVHINELHQNESTEKTPPVREEDETSQDMPSLNQEPKAAVSPSRKRRRNLSGSPQESKPPDEVDTELPTTDSTVSDLTQDGGCSYLTPDCLHPVASYEEELLKTEKSNDEEVIFVKTEDPEEIYDDPTSMGISSSYCNQGTESLMNCEPQRPAARPRSTIFKGATRNFRRFAPVQRLRTSAVSQMSHFSSDILSGTASNSEIDPAFKYDTEDDPNSVAECDSLPYGHWGNPTYGASSMDVAALGSKRQYQQCQNLGVRNDVNTVSNLPRRSSDNLWQVVSRFICSFPNCTLSFSTKQNLLRHQTQKHGRQKSRIVSQTRRYLEVTGSLCDSV